MLPRAQGLLYWLSGVPVSQGAGEPPAAAVPLLLDYMGEKNYSLDSTQVRIYREMFSFMLI